MGRGACAGVSGSRWQRARTFGFGDSGNDLGMLAAVETAVAMGNAMPEVKAVADYVTDDVTHDGAVTAVAAQMVITWPFSYQSWAGHCIWRYFAK